MLLAYFLCAILAVDLMVWTATKRLLQKQHSKHSPFMDRLMGWLGSWSMFWGAAFLTISWAAYVVLGHRGESSLDLVISIATALFDIIVLIGVNYARQIDHQLLADIHKKVTGNGDQGS